MRRATTGRPDEELSSMGFESLMGRKLCVFRIELGNKERLRGRRTVSYT